MRFSEPGLCIRLRYSLSRRMSGRALIERKLGCLDTESAAADMVIPIAIRRKQQRSD